MMKTRYKIFYNKFGIFHASLSPRMKLESFEIFFKIQYSIKAHFRITKLLISSDVETPGEFTSVLHSAVCYKVFKDEYFSAFPTGTALLHINI